MLVFLEALWNGKKKPSKLHIDDRGYILEGTMWILFNILSAGTGQGWQDPSATLKVLETKRMILVNPSYFVLFWKGFEFFFILSWEYSYSVKFYSLRSWCMKRNLYRRVVGKLHLYLEGVKETSKWTKPKASCLWKRSNRNEIWHSWGQETCPNDLWACFVLFGQV